MSQIDQILEIIDNGLASSEASPPPIHYGWDTEDYEYITKEGNNDE